MKNTTIHNDSTKEVKRRTSVQDFSQAKLKVAIKSLEKINLEKLIKQTV